jgi:endo-1,4-beta-D-glucanase Y
MTAARHRTEPGSASEGASASPRAALRRRDWLAALALLPAAASLPAWAQSSPGGCMPMGDWIGFAARHIQPDGRVIDFDTPQQHSTSEGQSYAMFFALVHDDRRRFERVLDWTEANLSDGRLAQRLPAWQWGLRTEGGWGVLDANPASDADLWIAYALLEAARLWSEPRYQTLGRAVLSLAAREEVVALPGLGRMLLPWPHSVASGPAWRLNPSYLPLQLLRRFQHEEPEGPWKEVADNTVRMIAAVSPQGFAPDWCAWSSEQQRFVADPEKGVVGSYDAIRVYLWAGMLNPQEPARAALLKALYGPRRAVEPSRPPPELVDTAAGTVRGTGPAGFSGALLPYLKSQGATAALGAQLARIPADLGGTSPSPASPLPYYERMLILFGQGWLDGRFAFTKTGQLQTQWRPPCPSTRTA